MAYISNAVATGQSVLDIKSRHRFELSMNGETAFLDYKRDDDVLKLMHTEVPEALRGGEVGASLVEAALRSARSGGLRVVAVCPFVIAYMRRHSVRRSSEPRLLPPLAEENE